MDLYLLRHGDAQPPAGEAPDSARQLTEVGRAKMREEAKGMKRLGLSPEVILTSPYARARETAEIVACALEVAAPIASPELACGCSLGDLSEALRSYASCASVMVVGHEPDLSTIICQLISGASVKMEKGGLARVTLAEAVPGAGTLRWLLTPSHLIA